MRRALALQHHWLSEIHWICMPFRSSFIVKNGVLFQSLHRYATFCIVQINIIIHRDSWTCNRVQRVVAATCNTTIARLWTKSSAHCCTSTRFLPISRSTEVSCATTSHPEVGREFFQWNVPSSLSRCLFHSVSTIINICETQCRDAAAVVVMNTPEFNQTWLPRAASAFTVHFLRRAGGGAGVPGICLLWEWWLMQCIFWFPLDPFII